ncbi:MAG: hypothetical protein FLDDKLPJ_02130 [Phycisphaerae bacterium]|nr:hypothetical protein [Phycisphaerae bacterium]
MTSGKHTARLVAAALLGVVRWTAPAETIELPSVRDNTLYEDALGGLSNGAGEHFFVGTTGGGGIRRGLLRFDLAPIPEDARITGAVIHLHLSRTPLAGTPVRFHRALADWGEGDSNAGDRSGGGAPAKPGDATWLHTFHDAQFWAAAGGDFATPASGTFTANGVGFYPWTATPGMLDDLQVWVNDPSVNFGWCMTGDEEEVSANRFDTRENIVPSNRPRLTVEYVVPPPCPADLNGDGRVDLADVSAFQNGFGISEGATPDQGDTDGDGDVDLLDYRLLASALGSTCP